MDAPSDQSLRVLAWPAFENRTGNPYNRLLYEAMEKEGTVIDEFTPERLLTGEYDVWHLHWPENLLSICKLLDAMLRIVGLFGLMVVARIRGIRIVWTVHNLDTHEQRHLLLERLFWTFFIPRIDGFISLSEVGLRQAEVRFPALRNISGFVVPHGHYRTAYPEAVLKDEARERLHLETDDRVMLYVGRIRPYKNVPRLIRAFRLIEDERARLLVVGESNDEVLQMTIAAEAAQDSRVQCELRFIPDDDLPIYLGTSDLVVLPYRNILHSGAALLALSFNRPVLVPDLGAMGELQTQIGHDWVQTYAGPLTHETLREGLDWAVHTTRDSSTSDLDVLAWPTLARQTLTAYRAILSDDSQSSHTAGS